MDTKFVVQLGASLLGVAILAACGGGNSDSAPTKTGIFVDSAVQGLSYAAEPSDLRGTTDAAGTFRYQDGDTVSFTVGGVLLGSADGQDKITPKTLADKAAPLSATDSANIASNIARFLQTFDADGNPDNGIDVTAAAGKFTGAKAVDFNKAPDDFSSDPGYLQAASDAGATLITSDQAAAHTERSFRSQLAGTWVYRDTDALLTVTFFTDGTYLMGGENNEPDCGTNLGNGVEWGNFGYDAATATITITADGTPIDTSGSCGLNDPGKAQQQFSHVAISGNTLSFTDSDGPVVLTRAPDSKTGIAGSWLADQPLNGQQLTHPVVATFFSDGAYVLNDTGFSEINQGATPGTERGTWKIDNGVLKTTQTVDTDGASAGLSNLEANTTLKVGADGKLHLKQPSQSDVTFTRLPLAEKINAGNLAGAWYVADAAGSIHENTAQNYFLFFADGTYLMGSQEDDPDCYNDYANHGEPLASYEDGSNGSESAHWRLDIGTGILTPDRLVFESNGSCGLYNKFSMFPENRLILSKVDANTINVTFYEFQDGGTGENNSATFQENHIVLKRIPVSGTAPLVGAWVKDGTKETILFFGDSAFIIDTEKGGGVERVGYSLNMDQTALTLDGLDATNCVDTINSESDCQAEPGELPFAFNVDKTAFVLTEDGQPETFRKVK